MGIARRRVLRGASILIGLYLLALLAAWVRGPRAAPRHPYFAEAGFLVVAHRGGSGMSPENTLPLFREAVKAGADVLEMDARLSSDGVLVVHHDRTVRRTTGVPGRVDSLTAAQLQALDAGFGWSRDGRSHPFRGKGYRIPRLAEVLRAFPGQRMMIELKPRQRRAAEALCGEIRGAGMQDRVAVAGFDGGTLGTFRDLCPEVATAAAGGEVIAWKVLHLLGLGNLYDPEFQLFAVPERAGRRPAIPQVGLAEGVTRHHGRSRAAVHAGPPLRPIRRVGCELRCARGHPVASGGAGLEIGLPSFPRSLGDGGSNP